MSVSLHPIVISRTGPIQIGSVAVLFSIPSIPNPTSMQSGIPFLLVWIPSSIRGTTIKMMMMINSLLLLLFSTFVAATATAASSSIGGMYEIVPRGGHHRLLQDGEGDPGVTESPDLISFDGDLDAIAAMALAKANASGNGDDDGGDPFSCPGGATEHLEILTWSYSIETVPDANVATVFGEVSEITLEEIAPASLQCQNQDVAYANIVAMDANNITSSTSETRTCTPKLKDSYVCTVILGRMRIFLSEAESADEATSVVLQNIQAAYEKDDFVNKVGSGLLAIEFLPETGNDDNPNIKGDGADGTEKDVGEGSGSSVMSSLVFIAVGSALLVIAVGAAYMWRRKGQEARMEGMATQFAGDITSNPSNESGDSSRFTPRPTSPLSQLIPGSYRLGDNTSILGSTNNMSPVYELEDDSVVVSESGYTDEAGRTDGEDSTTTGTSTAYGSGMLASTSSKYSTPPYLGALPRPGMTVGDVDMENPSDSELDTSAETLSPVKMFGDKLLETLHDEESPASTVEDDELLFDNQNLVGNSQETDEEEEEEKFDEERRQQQPDPPESDGRNESSGDNSHSPAHTSDIFTVPPSMDDIDLEEQQQQP